jgi:hypothetical protein
VTEPPSGQPAPETMDGLELVALAEQICARYRAEFPDEEQRYGPAGQAWCLHDNQYILAWALLGQQVLEINVAWLAGVLAARDFPLDRLRRDLEIAAEVCPQAADALRAAAATVPV